MSNAGTTAALSVADLNTDINHEPRILDLRLAERLGYERPRDLRGIIKKHRAELRRYGILVCGDIPQTNIRIRKGGRAPTEFWLNEPQTLLLCMFSRTEAAADVRQEVIEVYMAYRLGLLVPVGLEPGDDRRVDDVPRMPGHRFKEERLRLGYATAKEFAAAMGWRRNRVTAFEELNVLPRKLDDVHLLLGIGFDYMYWRSGVRTLTLAERKVLAWHETRNDSLPKP